jgi:hypothetical protein
MNMNSKFHHVGASASNHDGANTSTTHANGCSSQKQHSQEHNIQILVRLDNCKTHCLNFFSSPSFKIDNSQIIDRLSNVTGIPSQMLRLHNKKVELKIVTRIKTFVTLTNIIIHSRLHQSHIHVYHTIYHIFDFQS